MTHNTYQPMLYREVVESASAELSGEGMADDKISEIAHRIAANLCDKCGGEIRRIPLLHSLRKTDRDANIKKDSKTMNVNEMARKYGLSVRSVYGVIEGE